MTISEYRSKLWKEVEQAAIEKDVWMGRELMGILELIDDVPDGAPARFMAISELLQILEAAAELRLELEKRGVSEYEGLRTTSRFIALAEAYKLRGESKTLPEIAALVSSAFPTPVPPQIQEALSLNVYRLKLAEEIQKAKADDDPIRAKNLTAVLERITDIKGEMPANLLTFDEIMRTGNAATDLAESRYDAGEIIEFEKGLYIHRFLAVADLKSRTDQWISLASGALL